MEKSNPTSAQCRILSEPQRAQMWGDQQGQSGEGVRGQAGDTSPALGLAEGSGPAQLHGRGQGSGHSSGRSGAGCGADSGQRRKVGPTVSCPSPAADAAPRPQNGPHFRVAENRHPPFQKVTLRQHNKV